MVSTDGLVAGTAIEQGVNPGELTTLPVIPLLERASITDANLEKCIKGALGISEEAPLTIPSAQTLTVLECDGSDFQPERIVSLEGLEVLRNLRTLVLRDNVFISDISPLSGLAQLTSLDLERNAINDISSLAGLVGLTFLNLSDNMITDIAGLEDLAQLRELRLSENTVSDITSLAELAQLENLRLEDNSITNIDALSGLTRLAGLHLSGNMIGDFTPLQGLAQLINLGLNQTSIDDLSVVSGLSQLQSLFLTGNGISDVNPVAGLTQLENLALDNNSVSNLQPFVNNVDFAPDFIGLFGNPLDVDDCADLQTLMSRGTNISHDVPCAP